MYEALTVQVLKRSLFSCHVAISVFRLKQLLQTKTTVNCFLFTNIVCESFCPDRFKLDFVRSGLKFPYLPRTNEGSHFYVYGIVGRKTLRN